jgi:hypothetical protein
VPAVKSYDYSIIANMLATAAAATSGAVSTSIAAAALSAAAAAAAGASATASGASLTQTSHGGDGILAGSASPKTLGKRCQRDWELQQTGCAVPASTAVDQAADLDSVVSSICAAAAGADTAAAGGGSSCVCYANAEGDVSSPAKRRVRFRDSLPGRPLQEFRLFLKHESPCKVSQLYLQEVLA